MDERAFLILCLLAGDPDDPDSVCDSAVKAKTTLEISSDSNDPLLYSESTVYKNLQYLLSLGYVRYGIKHGRSFTYYISQSGKDFIAKA